MVTTHHWLTSFRLLPSNVIEALERRSVEAAIFLIARKNRSPQESLNRFSFAA